MSIPFPLEKIICFRVRLSDGRDADCLAPTYSGMAFCHPCVLTPSTSRLPPATTMAITLAKDRSMTTLSLPYGSATLLADALPPALDPALVSGPATDRLCAARVHLLNSLPQVSIAWSLWCGNCGTLRDGIANPPSRKRKATTSEDELERDLERELHAAMAAMDAEDCKRRSAKCMTCGSQFRRPKPTPSFFASARTVARTRRASRLAAEVKPDEPPAPKEPSKCEQALAVPEEERGKAALTRTPSLAHIPSSDPGLPTYPPPTASSGQSPAPPSPPPAKKRKTKKSGLAKLLAQNKAREAEKSSGNWGLS